MKKMLAVAILFCVLGPLAWAGETKDAKKPAAQVIGLVPPVEYSADNGAFAEVKLWQKIEAGTKFRTGKGRLALRLADKSVVRIRQNTELTLNQYKEEGEKRNVILGLASGLARFLVAKLTKGSTFDVRTPNAVAAVKGTDFETGFDPGQNSTNVSVFSSEGGGVLLTDLKGEVEKVIHENEGGGLGSNGLEENHPLTQEQQQGAQQENQQQQQQEQQAPPPEGDQGSNSGQGGAGGGPDTFSDALGDALNDLGKTLNSDSAQNIQDHNNDAFTGLAYLDRNGYQVQTSHVVLRPDPATVEKIHTTRRIEGPLAGNCVLKESLTYNQALPGDWQSVVGRPLNDPANLPDPLSSPSTGNLPIFWQTEQRLRVDSPLGDSIDMLSTLSVPGMNYSQISLLQPYKTDYRVNGVLTGSENWDGGLLAASVYPNDTLLSIGDFISVQASQNPDKTWLFTYANTTNATEMFRVTAYLLDDAGKVLNTDDFIDPYSFQQMPPFMKPLWNPYPCHLELFFESTSFQYGPGIDLFFEKGEFQKTFPWYTQVNLPS